MEALLNTDFNLPGQQNFYKGKVRDVYSLENNLLVIVATDRISAFDVVLPRGIPHKGQVLNQIANNSLDQTEDIVPNWKINQPHPMVTLGHKAEPFKVEMVIRGFLSGHAWRTYRDGHRTLCGVPLPPDMNENDPFVEPIITPTTKADHGVHDEDISREEILNQGLVKEENYIQLENFTRALFRRGQEAARQRDLLLVDTKYEFGQTPDGKIVLIDEIHTPDSSRYFYKNGYHERQEKGLPQKQLSKEFVRQWLIEQGYQGQEGQPMPTMSDDFVQSVSQRYIELYEKLAGQNFEPAENDNLHERIEENIMKCLKEV